MENNDLDAALEGILFASGEPVRVERLCVSLGVDKPALMSAAGRLADRCKFERRGVRLIVLDDAVQMTTAPEHADLIRRTLETRKPPPLSPSALEAVAVVAYFQPVTRAYVDGARGIDSSYTMSTLLEKDLIEECGRMEAPGRPILYRTTQTFLRTFGLSSLDELPPLPEFDGQMTISE